MIILKSFILFSFLNLSFAYKYLGRTMAYIDINADTFTDLIVTKTPNTIAVYVANDKDSKIDFVENTDYQLQFNNSRILNIGVGDFDGDSWPDLAVSLTLDEATAKKSSACGGTKEIGHRVEICYGSSTGFKCHPLKTEINESSIIVYEEPLILDCDIDQLSDLLTTVCHEGKLRFVCFHISKKNNSNLELFDAILPFPSRHVGDSLIPAQTPTSHAFVDVTGDLSPEIVLWTKPTDETNLVDLQLLRLDRGPRWIPFSKNDTPMPDVPTPGKTKSPQLMKLGEAPSAKNSDYRLGQSIYDDFNKDGIIDHLVPFCQPDANNECTTIYFNVWIARGTWTTIPVVLDDGKNQRWSIYMEPSGTMNRPSFQVRSGDYTQDGYPDLLIVLQQAAASGGAKTERKRAAFLLENVPCPAGELCQESFKRSFQIWWKPFEDAKEGMINSVTSASFFDLGEDGTLDVLLEIQNSTAQIPFYTGFAQSVFEGDTTFLKIQVFTATCLEDCRKAREGSAISLPGAALYYLSSDADGNPIKGSYTQRSVTSYRPLLLPYALFGLGRTPNFVEKLYVGVPSYPFRNKSWEQLVPNSRIYVVPYPADDPRSWVHRLYLTPNRLIIYSLIALSSVCGLIIIVVLALHMQERRMDRKERELQRERFHFDAM